MSFSQPIFDSLSHPRLHTTGAAEFAVLAASLRASGYRRACAVGMPADDNYDDAGWLDACAQHPIFVPVAPLYLDDNLAERLAWLKRNGFAAVKIHPRELGARFTVDWLSQALGAAADVDLPVMLCTYTAHRFGGPECVWGDELLRCLAQHPETRIVLLHGGVTGVLQWADVVRHNPNLLLDLSFTLCKYPGSSLDADLRFLASRFDQRICVGSDFPDFSPAATRQRFEWLVDGLATDKAARIAHQNLADFLQVEWS